MNIRKLDSALKNIQTGQHFFKKFEGVGEYYFDALFANTDFLTLYPGIYQ